MRPSVSHPGALLVVLLLSTWAVRAADDDAAIREARAALARRDGREALRALDRMPADRREAPNVAVLRLEALYLAGHREEGDALVARLSAATEGDAGLSYSAGMALARVGQFDRAESFLSRALAVAPGNFGALYNLGVAASFAGHNERAREVLESALRQQPQNVDVLYSLAYVDAALMRREEAVRLLAQAARLAPRRADIQKLLAMLTTDLGALADSMAAWERYLKLEPNDDTARRERGYTAVRMGRFDQGIADLEWFLARHPDDALGHYELGLAHSQADPAAALNHLDRSLTLKPNFVEAHSARGSLYYRQGKPELAVTDLESAASLRPDDPINLDRLGQAYLAMDRPAEAARILRRAAELAPDDSRIQLHLGRALADAGHAAESKAAMDRFRQLGPHKSRDVPAGLVEYLSLTPEQQHADYRARVRKAVSDNPADAAAETRYLQLLLEDGNIDQAAAMARQIAGLKPGAAVLAGAGRTLLVFKQYALAKELLEQAAPDRPPADVQLDLAIASFRAAGPGEGLQRMDRVPDSGRSGDYYLARAQMLHAAGRPEDAVAALDQALRAAPRRTDLYQQAAAFLIGSGQAQRALQLLDRAVRVLPQDRELLLMKATTLELAGKSDDARRLLNEIQNRSPEWHAGWVAQGIILGTHQRHEEARQALETAAGLGARSPEAYYCLADWTLRAAPERIDVAEAAIREALRLAPGDPWIQSLAGRIAFEKGQYATAVERQREAVRLRPRLIQAHENLAQAYSAMGRKQEAQAELEQARKIQKDSSAADQERPSPAGLFQAKPPRDW